MPKPTTLELLEQIAERYGVDMSEFIQSTQRTEILLLQGILEVLLSGGGDIAFNGDRPILREGLITTGETIGGATVKEFLENYFFPALSPLGVLTPIGASILEFDNRANIPGILSWQAEKRTNPITSINVGGVAIVPTGDNQNGEQAISITSNETNTFTLLISDGSLSSTTQIKYYFRHGYYWGKISDTANITDAQILALTGAGVGTGKVLDTSRDKTFDGINGAGNYLVFAFPVSWGAPVFLVNGLPNSAFTKIREDDFVNAMGYSEPYQVWASNTKQNNPIAKFEIQ